MAYKVNELAKLSGVSVRSLRFYDEIGLLKPAYVGSQGYRFYQEREVLLLQQILFFKELDFDLATIKKIVNQDDFDVLASLKHHHQALLAKRQRVNDLLLTVEKTIKRLQGNSEMKDKEFYFGFRPEKQDEYEQYWIDTGKVSKEQISLGNKRLKNWSKADWQQIKAEGDDINQLLVKALESGLKPSDLAVQELVTRHYAMIKLFWEPQIKADKERYRGLGEFYLEHPEMNWYFQKIHPKLADFLAEAMRIFAEEKLT